MYSHKMNEHKLRRSKDSMPGAAKRSTRRKRSSSPVMTIIISPEKYEALERANNHKGGIILNVISADNIKKQKVDLFLGSMIVNLA